MRIDYSEDKGERLVEVSVHRLDNDELWVRSLVYGVTKVFAFKSDAPIEMEILEDAPAIGLAGNREQTSAKIASLAAKGLKDPASMTKGDIRSICASALTQAGE